MRYVGFSIENYKGIRKADLSFGDRNETPLITLVGLNESGKTTVLEAIRDFSRDINENEYHEIIPKSKKDNFNGYIEIIARLELEDADDEYISELLKEQKLKARSYSRIIEINKRMRFDNSLHKTTYITGRFASISYKKARSQDIHSSIPEATNRVLFKRIYEEKKPEIIYYPNFLDKFPRRIYLQEEKIEKDNNELIYRNRFFAQAMQDVLDSFKDKLTIKDHILSRLLSTVSGQDESLRTTTNKMARAITKAVINRLGKKFGSKEMKTIINHGQDESRGFYLEVKIQDDPEEFHLDERSLGFRWFFTFILFTEFRKYRSAIEGRKLFLLDEPASNLHSDSQLKALEVFTEMLEDNSIVYATHSQHMIDPEQIEGVYIVKNNALNYDDFVDYDSSKTDIAMTRYRQFAAEHADQTTYFQPVLNALEYQPSKLEMVPRIIVTEGKSDFYAYTWLTKYCKIVGAYDFGFYPGGGADSNYKVISLYLGWCRDFLVLLDGDKPGQLAKRKYVKEFGEIAKSFVFTMADFNPEFDGLELEDLFEEESKLMMLEKAGIESKSLSKSDIQKSFEWLCIKKEPIKFDRITNSRLKKLMSGVRNKLSDLNLY